MRLLLNAVALVMCWHGAVLREEPLVGRWMWVDQQTLVFKADGGAECTKGGQRVKDGRWSAKAGAPRKYTVAWAQGGPQEFEVSADGWSLQSVNADGVPQRGERLD